MKVSSVKLTQHQTDLLLAMHLATSPVDAKLIAHRTTRTAISSKTLQQMNMVVAGENGIELTDVGRNELVINGYIDDAGSLTQYGEEYYQRAVKSLNEFALTRALLTSLHD